MDDFERWFYADLQDQVSEIIGAGLLANEGLFRRLEDKGQKGYMMAGKRAKRPAGAPQRAQRGKRGRPQPLVLSEALESLQGRGPSRIKGLLGWLESQLQYYVNLKAIWGRLRGQAVEVGGGRVDPDLARRRGSGGGKKILP